MNGADLFSNKINYFQHCLFFRRVSPLIEQYFLSLCFLVRIDRVKK